MKDYSEMSDGEINFSVAEITGESAPKVFEWGIGRVTPDYCNNPADAWPIIVANRIALMPDASEHGAHQWWDAQSSCQMHGIQYQANPLRAAMIVYLQMMEVK